MISILSLWLPIVVSAVAVFVVSSILHMVLKYHNKDYRELPNEEGTLEALRSAGVTPGLYHFPHCGSPAEMKNPEVAKRFDTGPVGFMTIMPNGLPNMGKFLTQWFLFLIVVGIFLAYLAGRTYGAGEDYLVIFRFVGTVAFMTHGLSQGVDVIWKGAPWSSVSKHIFDGLIYGLVTAGVFGWLWP